jgi:LysR family glycine cleavage system transcriptional activator
MSQIDWHRLPPLSTLRAFEATARLKGYSAAARALNVTPAAIAQQVRKLESELGVGLVRRDGRGLVLTEAGRQLAAPLGAAFALISGGIEDVRRKEASRGVRVSTTHFFCDAMILPKLGEFWTRHPGVQVTFSPDGNLQPVDLEDFDICVRGSHTGESWPGYATRRLLSSQLMVCAAPSLLETANGDLSALPWLYDRGTGQDLMLDFAEQAGFDPIAMRIIDPGSAKLEIEAALMGYGLSISTDMVIRRHLDDGTLVRVDTPLDVTVTYSAIFRKGPLSEAVQRFLDWLTAICAEYPKG